MEISKNFGNRLSVTCLALLINNLLFCQTGLAAETGDWNIGDSQQENKTVSNDTWHGNTTLGASSGGELTLDNAQWHGNASSNPGTELQGSFITWFKNQSGWWGNVDLNKGDLQLGIHEQSYWEGQINVTDGSAILDMLDSEARGDISVTGYDDNTYVYSTTNIFDRSTWQGNVSLESKGDNYIIYYGNVNNGSRWVGDVNIKKATSGNYAQFGITISENSQWTGSITTNTENVMSMGHVTLYDDASWVGDIVVNSQNADVNIYLSAMNNSSWTGNVDIDALDGQDSVVEIRLDNGSTWTGHFISRGVFNKLSNVELLNGSVWNMTGDTATKKLYSDGGIVNFVDGSTRSGGYHTLTVDDLTGATSFNMRAGFSGPGLYGSDKLVVLGSKSASAPVVNHNITVTNNGSDNTHGTESITLVQTADGHDRFTLTNNVELGGYIYSLEQSGSDWILRSGAQGSSWRPRISSSANAAANSLNVGYLTNYAETQTLLQRMGDLRQSNSAGNVWTRAYGGGFNSFSGGLMRGFDMSYKGFQVGADKQLLSGNNPLYVGLLYGQTHSSQDYTSGSGSGRNQHLGLYGSYMHASGIYVDGLIKYNRMKNNYSVADSAGAMIIGNARSDGFAASLETGKRFSFSAADGGVYLEPQLQISVARQGSASFHSTNGLRVRLNPYTSVLGRTDMLLGYELNKGGAPTNIYLKTGYVHEFNGNTDFYLNNSKQTHSFKGDWWSNGIGATTQIKQHSLYFDVERADGNRFKQHQINAGYRFSF